MPNLDRFKPPTVNEEPRAICDNCGGETFASDFLYDEYSEQYFCDRACFHDWADEHFDEVSEFYFDMNVG